LTFCNKETFKAQSFDVKSFKSLHATKWTKITNEMKAFVNFGMGTYTTYKDTFIIITEEQLKLEL
jgi:hypothetical protein